MKSIQILKLAMALAALAWSGTQAQAMLEVSASVNIQAKADFYGPLSARGTWVEVGTYGRCWHPTGVVVGWRPYCDGYWVWTDCGWYWQSDEPWAWACYHYGTWVLDPAYGWVWVPGVEWAPAWVAWRCGDGYVGWAPLAPSGVVVEREFVFVESRRFQKRVRPSTVIINDTKIINRTTVINNLKREPRSLEGARSQTVVVNNGPGSGFFEQATGKRLKAVSISTAARRTTVPRGLPAAAPAEVRHDKPVAPPTAPVGHGEQPDAASPRENGREPGAPFPAPPASRDNPGHGGFPPGQSGNHGHGHDKE